MLDFKVYLNQIFQAIEKIEASFARITKEDFMKDLDLQDATLMRLQVIGENIKNVPAEIKKKNKDIRWKKMERLRNIISHRYAVINYEIIWNFITEIRKLKEDLLKLAT